MKTLTIFLNNETLDEAVSSLDTNHNGYALIDGNLFMIDKITTILKPELLNSLELENNTYIINFSYADRVMPMRVKLVLNLDDASCLKFIQQNKYLNESQFTTILNKAGKCMEENSSYSVEKIDKIIDEMVLNETIILLTQAVNKEDCESIKNDVISKYETWKERTLKANEILKNKMNAFYLRLIEAKMQ